MKKAIILLLLSIFLIGCSENNETQISSTESLDKVNKIAKNTVLNDNMNDNMINNAIRDIRINSFSIHLGNLQMGDGEKVHSVDYIIELQADPLLRQSQILKHIGSQLKYENSIKDILGHNESGILINGFSKVDSTANYDLLQIQFQEARDFNNEEIDCIGKDSKENVLLEIYYKGEKVKELHFSDLIE